MKKQSFKLLASQSPAWFSGNIEKQSQNADALRWNLLVLKLFSFFFLFIFTVILTGLSAFKLYATSAASLAAELTQSQFSNYLTRTSSTEKELAKEVFRHWNSISDFSSLDSRINFGKGKAALLSFPFAANITGKTSILCEAYQDFSKAVLQDPANATYNIALADIQVQLPHVEQTCNPHIDNMHFIPPVLSATERLDYAVSLGPYRVYNLYQAALVFAGVGNKKKALQLLRRDEELNPYFYSAQRNYLQQLVTSEAELQEALPRRFPSIVNWVNDFSVYRPNDFKRWRKSFGKALHDSVIELEERFSKRKITADDYLRYLLAIRSLTLSNLNEETRIELDLQLTNLWPKFGKHKWAKFLKSRSNLKRIPILKSISHRDYTPLSSSLSNWHPDDSLEIVALDQPSQSLGIFIPPSNSLRVLLLSPGNPGTKIKKPELAIFASNSNGNYLPVTKSCHIDSFLIGNRHVFAIQLPEKHFTFYKIHYKGSSWNERYSNTFADLIQGYGSVSK